MLDGKYTFWAPEMNVGSCRDGTGDAESIAQNRANFVGTFTSTWHVAETAMKSEFMAATKAGRASFNGDYSGSDYTTNMAGVNFDMDEDTDVHATFAHDAGLYTLAF